ncbi:TPA: hypothetical protein ACH3X3_013170 [Trebouxia sp. C0006]
MLSRGFYACLVCSVALLSSAAAHRQLLQNATGEGTSAVKATTPASAPTGSAAAATTSNTSPGPSNLAGAPTISMAASSASAVGIPSATPKLNNTILISVDGLHSSDLTAYIALAPNSTMATLAKQGVLYPNAYLPGPSDSFPGILALTTGNNVSVTGVYYDDSYDRNLYPAGACAVIGAAKPTGPNGTECLFSELQDYETFSIGGAPGVGAFNGLATNVTTLQTDFPTIGLNGTAVNESTLPLDAACDPVHAWRFNQANTIFQVALAAGKRTAWIDKGPYYEVVQGQTGNGVMDLYTPEISCQCGDNQTGIPSTAITNGLGVDLAKNITAARAYDELHVQAVINQINGKHSSGNYAMQMPNLFGLNFQAVSVGQKYAGYQNNGTAFSPGLKANLDYVDQSFARILAALTSSGNAATTGLVITAKHGQQPVTTNATLISPTPIATALKNQNISVAQFTTDDIGLIWLTSSNQTTAALTYLRTLASNTSYGILDVNQPAYYGLVSNVVGRTPDLVIVPLAGVVFASPGKKLSEHGGLMQSDLNVALMVYAPQLATAGTVYNSTLQLPPLADPWFTESSLNTAYGIALNAALYLSTPTKLED